jgi:hypothetical protein
MGEKVYEKKAIVLVGTGGIGKAIISVASLLISTILFQRQSCREAIRS